MTQYLCAGGVQKGDIRGRRPGRILQGESQGRGSWERERPIFKGCEPLLVCCHGQEAGSRRNVRAEYLADTHVFGFRRVKPRTPILALDLPDLPLAFDHSNLLMLAIVLTCGFVLNKGLESSVLFLLLRKSWASGEWAFGPDLGWK